MAARPMRLLLCCEFYHPSRGGVQEVMRQVASRLARAGHDVTVATSHLAERNAAVIDGVRIREFKVRGNLARGMRGEVERYRDFVAGFGADAVLVKAAQQWTFDALWPVLDRIAARKVFVPCGFSGLHDPDFFDYFRQMPQVLRKFDHLIFYAEKYRDIDFARAHGLGNFSIVPNGASELEFDGAPDPGIRARLGIADEDFVFLTVGSPIAMKGHREIAEAYARLDGGGRRTTLILNGNWPVPQRWTGRVATAARRAADVLGAEGLKGVKARYRAMLRQRQILGETAAWIARADAQPGKRVLCTNLPRSDLVEVFKTANLLVFASNIEYSPLVLFEAAAAGTPFLSVPVGNAEEIARWTGGGSICPAPVDPQGFTRADPSALARDMQRCMNDPDTLARLGATGKARWRERFTWQAIAPRYQAILAGRETEASARRAVTGESLP